MCHTALQVDFTGGECDEDEDDSDLLGENNKISSDQVRAGRHRVNVAC